MIRLNEADRRFIRYLRDNGYTSWQHPAYYSWMGPKDRYRANRLKRAGVVEKFTHDDGMICCYLIDEDKGE